MDRAVLKVNVKKCNEKLKKMYRATLSDAMEYMEDEYDGNMLSDLEYLLDIFTDVIITTVELDEERNELLKKQNELLTKQIELMEK